MIKVEWDTIPKPCRSDENDFPSGTAIFTGRQGSGKTLSATHYIARLKSFYPNLYVYSNIQFKLADRVLSSSEIADHILDVRPDGAPIAFLLDEIQTVLFNGKKSVSIEVFKSVCQQRKAQKTIIGTAQALLDIDINYRRDEQLLSVIECSKLFKFQIERWCDPSTLDLVDNKYVAQTMPKNKLYGGTRVWKRHDEAFDLYDTFEIVNAVMQIDNNLRKPKNESTIILNNINKKGLK